MSVIINLLPMYLYQILCKILCFLIDLHVHKVMIRRVQLMVTCMTAMVECMVEANKTGLTLASQSAGVKVLTSVSRINISFHHQKSSQDEKNEAIGSNAAKEDSTLADDDNLMLPNITSTNAAAIKTFSKSFKNITMNIQTGYPYFVRLQF